MYQLLGGHSSGYWNGGSSDYSIGFNVNPLGNKLYQNAGNITEGVYNDSQYQLWASEHPHTLEVLDLKEAGLNPWLSAGGSGISNAGSVNPSMDSLTSLLQVLSGTLSTESTYTQSSKRLFDSVVKGLQLLIPW